MSTAMRIDLTKLHRFAASLGTAGTDIFAKHFVTAMVESGLLIENKAKRAAPVGLGALSQSISSDVSGVGLSVKVEIGSPIEYAPAVELGTRPYFIGPLDGLKLWAQRKFGMDEGEAASFAMKIKQNVSKTGFKAKPYLFPAIDEDRITQLFARSVEAAMNELVNLR